MKYLTMAMLCLCMTSVHAVSSFECLPDSTLVSVGIPNGQDLSLAVKKTKLYALLNNEQRWNKIENIINTAQPGAIDQVEAALKTFGLSLDDLPKMIHGELGVAVAVHQNDNPNQAPFFTVFVYFEPQPELSGRLAAAMEQAAEMDQAEGTVRTDFKVGEHDVVELANDAKDTRALFNKRGAKFLIAMSDVKSAEASKNAFASFLDAHVANGDENGFAKIVMSTPGLADGLPKGATLFQMAVNPHAIIKLIPKDKINLPAMAGADVLTAVGADNVKPGIIQVNIQGNKMHTYMFMGIEKPAVGLTRLWDLPELEAKPAAFVANTVPSYGQVGIDLQHVYNVITELAVKLAGPMAQMYVTQINQQPMAFLGTDLQTFLGTFGKRLVILDFGNKRPAGAENAMNGSFTNRMAFIWDMNDTTALRQAMPFLQQMAAQNGGMAANEQGATGIRFNMSMMQPGLEGSVFVTDGQLLVALGGGVTEDVLNAMQNPPAAADALNGSKLHNDAVALMPPKKGFSWGFQDAGKMLETAVTVMRAELEPMALLNPEIGIMLSIFPTAEEVKGVFGVATNAGYNTENGVVVSGSVELGLAE